MSQLALNCHEFIKKEGFTGFWYVFIAPCGAKAAGGLKGP